MSLKRFLKTTQTTHPILLNEGLLAEFETWLQKKYANPEVSEDLLQAVEVFLDDYLVRKGVSVLSSVGCVSEYFMDWLPGSEGCDKDRIKTHIAALKQFYRFLEEKKRFSTEEVEMFQQLLRKNSSRWLANW